MKITEVLQEGWFSKKTPEQEMHHQAQKDAKKINFAYIPSVTKYVSDYFLRAIDVGDPGVPTIWNDLVMSMHGPLGMWKNMLGPRVKNLRNEIKFAVRQDYDRKGWEKNKDFIKQKTQELLSLLPAYPVDYQGNQITNTLALRYWAQKEAKDYDPDRHEIAAGLKNILTKIARAELDEASKPLDEITRRDLLKGLGAAGALAATGASADPFKHITTAPDPMDDTQQTFASLISKDRKAQLQIHYKQGVIAIILLSDYESFKLDNIGNYGREYQNIRLRFGKGPTLSKKALRTGANYNVLQINDPGLIKQFVDFDGNFLWETTLLGEGKKVFAFDVDPDEILKKFQQGSDKEKAELQDKLDKASEKKNQELAKQQELKKFTPVSQDDLNEIKRVVEKFTTRHLPGVWKSYKIVPVSGDKSKVNVILYVKKLSDLDFANTVAPSIKGLSPSALKNISVEVAK